MKNASEASSRTKVCERHYRRRLDAPLPPPYWGSVTRVGRYGSLCRRAVRESGFWPRDQACPPPPNTKTDITVSAVITRTLAQRPGAKNNMNKNTNAGGPCKTKSDDWPTFLTPDEAADLLRTTRKAIYVKIERRQIPGVTRLGRRVLIRTTSLLDYLDQQSTSSLLEDQR